MSSMRVNNEDLCQKLIKVRVIYKYSRASKAPIAITKINEEIKIYFILSQIVTANWANLEFFLLILWESISMKEEKSEQNFDFYCLFSDPFIDLFALYCSWKIRQNVITFRYKIKAWFILMCYVEIIQITWPYII